MAEAGESREEEAIVEVQGRWGVSWVGRGERKWWAGEKPVSRYRESMSWCSEGFAVLKWIPMRMVRVSWTRVRNASS